MKRQYLLLFFMLFPLLMGTASAFTLHVDTPTVFVDRDHVTFQLRLTGTIPGDHYSYTVYTTPALSDGSAYPGNHSWGNITGTIKNLTIPSYDLPFEFAPFYINATVHEYSPAGVLISTETNQTIKSIRPAVSINGTNFISFEDAVPCDLSIRGGDLIGGFTINITSLRNLTIPYTYDHPLTTVCLFLTDNSSSRKLIAWTTKTVTYHSRFHVNGEYLGTDWDSISWHIPGAYGLRYYSSYYVYIGVSVSNGITQSNLYPTTDGSVSLVNFSVTTSFVGYTSNSLVNEFTTTWGSGNKFIGAVAYIETIPSAWSLRGWNAHGGQITSLGQAIDNYGASIGIPFLSIIIAFMVCAICCVIPWRIAVIYDFQLPNFVYGFAVVAGVVLDLSIGILDLWMFVLFLLVMVLTVFLRYREDIERTYSMVTGHPLSTRATVAGQLEEHQRSYLLPRARGIASQFLHKDEGIKNFRLPPGVKKAQIVQDKQGKVKQIALQHDEYGPYGSSIKRYLQPPPGYQWQKNPSGKRVLVKRRDKR